MKPSLEDFYEDVLGKAKRGLGISEEEIVKQSGVTAAQLEAALSGKYDSAVAEQLAPVLGLSASALKGTGEKSWAPQTVELGGLKQLHTAWDDMFVNAYLVWDTDSKQAVLFDTGADSEAVTSAIREHQLSLELILLTHAHPDHVAVLPELRKQYPNVPVYLHEAEVYEGKCEHPTEGDVFQVGELTVEVRFTPGHSPGGTTYVVTGLSRPVAIVGDAIFAGSMGGAPLAWQSALKVNREKILSLSEETILCPGHGPLTTVAEELQHNPFYGPGSAK